MREGNAKFEFADYICCLCEAMTEVLELNCECLERCISAVHSRLKNTCDPSKDVFFGIPSLTVALGTLLGNGEDNRRTKLSNMRTWYLVLFMYFLEILSIKYFNA